MSKISDEFNVRTENAGEVRVTLTRRRVGGNLHYNFWINGEPYRNTCKTPVEREARSKARAAVLAAAGARSGTLTLKQAIADCLATRFPIDVKRKDQPKVKGVSSESSETYLDAKGRLQAFETFSGADTCLDALDLDGAINLVQRFVDHRRKTILIKKVELANGKIEEQQREISGRTIKGDQLVLSRFFAWLIKRRNESGQRVVPFKANPADAELLDMPAVETRVKPHLTDIEIDALIAAGKSSQLWPVIVLCLSGFRPKGACRQTWERLELDQAEPDALVKEKGDERQIPLSPWSAGELLAWKSARDASGRIWPMHHDTAHDEMAKIRKAGGLSKNTTLQACRRTTEYKLYKDGVSPQLAAKIMGHSVQTAERHYVRFHMLNARGAVQGLNFSATPAQKPTQENSTDYVNSYAV